MTHGDDILTTLKTMGEDTLTTPKTGGEDTLTTTVVTHVYCVTTPNDVTYDLVTIWMTSRVKYVARLMAGQYQVMTRTTQGLQR